MTGYNIERVRVLVVDDNQHILHLFRNILNTFGVRDVQTATDGADAFKRLATFEADVLMVDWVMDPLDGLEFTKMMRTASDSPNPYIPIIMVTAHTEVARVEQARDAGVNEFLAKPVSAQAIYSRIKTLIEKPRPFIKSKSFFGPDRRRASGAPYGGSERRKPAPAAGKPAPETDSEAAEMSESA